MISTAYCNQKESYQLNNCSGKQSYLYVELKSDYANVWARDSGTRRHAPRFSRRARAFRLLRVSLPLSISYSRTSFFSASFFSLFLSQFLSFFFLSAKFKYTLLSFAPHLLFSLCFRIFYHVSSCCIFKLILNDTVDFRIKFCLQFYILYIL